MVRLTAELLSKIQARIAISKASQIIGQLIRMAFQKVQYIGPLRADGHAHPSLGLGHNQADWPQVFRMKLHLYRTIGPAEHDLSDLHRGLRHKRRSCRGWPRRQGRRLDPPRG